MIRWLWRLFFGKKELIMPPTHRKAPFLQDIGSECSFLCAGDKGCHQEIAYAIVGDETRNEAFNRAVFRHLDEKHPGWEITENSLRN